MITMVPAITLKLGTGHHSEIADGRSGGPFPASYEVPRGIGRQRQAFLVRANKQGHASCSRYLLIVFGLTLLSGIGIASAQQQTAPRDEGNGNWDPPLVTAPTTRR
jgi:hypothetical protein